jgi:hypothetical protein
MLKNSIRALALTGAAVLTDEKLVKEIKKEQDGYIIRAPKKNSKL